MAQGTLTANATASLTARGTTTATGSISWTAPSLPDGVAAWDSVVISGTWTWGGKGSITRVTINGTNTSDSIAFSVNISGKSSPLSITCVGNKNATGSNFTWSDFVVTYTYTEQGISHTMTVRYGTSILVAEEIEPPVSVTYNGSTISSVDSGQTKTLNCSGRVMATNVAVGGHTLNCADKYMSNDISVEVSE